MRRNRPSRPDNGAGECGYRSGSTVAFQMGPVVCPWRDADIEILPGLLPRLLAATNSRYYLRTSQTGLG